MSDNSHPDRWTWGGPVAVGVSALLVLVAPIPELPAAAQRLAAVTVLMAGLWAVRPESTAVTSLIPLALYPFLGISTAAATAKAYVDRNVFLYLGGFIIALAIERWNLHRRIALAILARWGSSPSGMVLGFMAATAFISMWISNTAATLMMLPIGLSVLTILDTMQDAALSVTGLPADPAQARATAASRQKFTEALLLGIAYAATCGGLATLVGTPTNVAFRGFWEERFVAHAAPAEASQLAITFGGWMAAFVPLSAAQLLVVWVVMTRGLRGMDLGTLGLDYFRRCSRELGPMSRPERLVLLVFATTALLWTATTPITIGGHAWWPGWPPLLVKALAALGAGDCSFLPASVDDSTVAIAMSLLLFTLPVRDGASSRPLLLWKEVEQQIPWGVLLLFGGGFAMAGAFESTGLSKFVGLELASHLTGWPTWAIIAAVCTLLTFLTEFTSNVATINTMLPVLAPLAVQLNMDARLILIPAAIAASCGFMMPAGTPPNAIVFGTGRLRLSSMLRYGLFLNIVGIILVTLTSLYLMAPIFGVHR